jgi:RNA polymerase sigma-70 factor, ECF subfamily
MAEGQVLDEGEEFERHRRYLSAVAYRLLGSLADAEDTVQDTWLRWQAVDRSTVQDPRAFLTTVVTRICYDLLGSARARREAYFGEWLPEPSIGDDGGQSAQSPEDAATLGESVSYAMLTVMEQLSPAERVAFVLHDVFAVEFDEIAEVLDRSPEAVRQLASRGRRRVRERELQRVGPHEPRKSEHRKAVAAFAAACTHGDIPGLMAVLDPNVVWHSDGGGIVSAGSQPVASAERVAKLLAGITKWFGPEVGLELRQAEVNGEAGVLVLDGDGAAMGVIAFEVVDGRIAEAYALVNPEKLTRVAAGAVSEYLPRRGQRAKRNN